MDEQINITRRELCGLFYTIRSMRYDRDDVYILNNFNVEQVDFLKKLGIDCTVDIKSRPPTAKLNFKSFLGGRTF